MFGLTAGSVDCERVAMYILCISESSAFVCTSVELLKQMDVIGISVQRVQVASEICVR
jgi:hypothetical protein